MDHSRAGKVARPLAALALVAGLLTTTPVAFAQDDDGGDATVIVYGGSSTTVSVIDVDASGGDGTAGASGGDLNTATVDGGTDSGATVGNGGDAAAVATGGELIQPDGYGISTGGNVGNEIVVGNTVGGAGINGGDATVLIVGGTMDVIQTVEMSAVGGVATADATGGDLNIVTSLAGASPTAGVGGNAFASASGGSFVFGNIATGGNIGGIITVGDTIGGDDWGCGCGEGGDALVTIVGGLLESSSITRNHVDGGEASSDASGGDANVIVSSVDDGEVAEDSVSVADMVAAEQATEVAASGTSLAAIGAEPNVGAIISVGDTVGGTNFGEDGVGGDAVVDVVGGDIIAHAWTEEGLIGDGGGNFGGYITIGDTSGGDAWSGVGGDALVGVEGGDIVAVASSADGNAYAGGNDGGIILVGDVSGGDGVNGEGGDAIVDIVGTDITADATAGGLDVDAPIAGDVEPTDGTANVSAGDGGTATASANAGSFQIGDSYAGDNTGAVISVGDVTGGTGKDGDGGDAIVLLDGGSITTGVSITASVNGGTATASAVGGEDNDAVIEGVDDGTNSVTAGNGGDANAEANGGNILIGDIYMGGNVGAVMSVGDVTGGDGGHGHNGGDAIVALEGTDITTTIILSLSADGGVATAYADGGDDNFAGVYSASGVYDGTVSGATVAVGNGGSANAEANAGNIVIGDLIGGNNAGSIFTVGDITGADGSKHGHGGDATVIIDGGSITSVIDLDISVDGGVATAYANGGDDNVGVIFASGETAGVYGGTLTVGNGGVANAEANGGTAIIGDLVAGANQGSIVTVGSLVGEPGAGTNDTFVWDVEGTDIVSTVEADISLEGGVATAYADGGDDNIAFLDVSASYGATVGGGSVAVGNGGVSDATANAGDATLGAIVSGGNVGSFSAIIVGLAADDDGGCDSDCGHGGGGGGGCHDDCSGGGGNGGSSSGGSSSGGGKGSTAVSALPNTGAGAVYGQSGFGLIALLLLGVGAAGAGIGLRRRLN